MSDTKDGDSDMQVFQVVGVGDGNSQRLPENDTNQGASRIFALIIGINTYSIEGFWNLQGAKADAERFKDYLRRELLVPEYRIELLLDTQATRKAIISSLERMANDDRIDPDDPIVIFYAGHGAEKDDLLGGETHKIQMLVPCDGAGIPDFVVGTLLEHISMKKGDNITVIFDCCNAASGTRGAVEAHESVYRTRAISPELVKYDTELDRELYARIGVDRNNSRSEFRSTKAKSHILLAACQSSEEAKEVGGQGVFTSALLKLFADKPPTILRYCDILRQMDVISGQNPQCEGYHQTRKIFDGKVETRSRLCFDIYFRDPSNGTFTTSTTTQLTLHAGSAQGITKGAKFNIYDVNDTSFSDILGEATVEDSQSIKAFEAIVTLGTPESTLKPPFSQYDTRQRYVAVLTVTGEKADLLIYIPPGDTFAKVFHRIRRNGDVFRYGWTVNTTETSKGAHLQAAMAGKKEVVFDLNDDVHSFSRQFKIPASDDRILGWVISKMAHFYRELDRRNPVPELTKYVTVEFYKLIVPPGGDDWNWRSFVRDPRGENFCRNNVIDFEVENDAPYGFKISNNSKRDLYPYVFHFDSSSLEIKSYYMVPASTPGNYKVDTPLKENKFLTLGHGSICTEPPTTYFIEGDQTMDLAFLKIYLTTKTVDFTNVPQQSPFEDINSRASREWRPGHTREDIWDALTIPMIQRRRI